ncbi:prolactin-releasing peptide receptor-like isoform X1 [Actinia tenebrosa]|uniref:Prolactin-releasing peptide receptor-like isoform X1 n=1 Tax=Actinia tenebrosa TaxID=6105 RepID=A0A6P8HLJ1_ACTTE|nr:prolactin-releasing peptide receptor-like isoform X1 [Actinia tenebrosa]
MTSQINNTTAANQENNAMPDILDVQVGLTILGVVSFVVSMVGNCAVIHIVRTRKHMRNTTNILISNMSAADILMTFVYPYLIKYYFVGAQWFGGVMGTVTCKLIISSQMISIFSSVYTLLVISIDRFLGVMKPMKRYFTMKVAKWSILSVWAASIAYSIPLIIVANVRFQDGVYICAEFWETSGMSPRDHVIIFLCLTYIIPLILIGAAYGMSGYKLWRSRPPGDQNSVTRVSHRSMRESRRKATKMLITVVVTFALCWLPLHVREIIRAEAPDVSLAIPLKLDLALPWFGFCNSCINPILYVIFSLKFRQEFKRTLFFWRPQSDFETFSSPGSPMTYSRYTTKLYNCAVNGRKAPEKDTLV